MVSYSISRRRAAQRIGFWIALAALSVWGLSNALAEPKAPSAARPAAKVAVKPAAKPAEPTAPRYDLKYKFRVGEVVRSEVTHRATVESTIEGTSQTAETRSKSVKAWRVTETSPGRIKFVHMVESIDMWQKTQGRAEVTYNSATDKKAPPGYEAVAAAVGVPLTEITMDDRGAIIKREQKQPQLDTQSPQITIPLPKEPVEVGHVWTAPLEIDVIVKGGATRQIRTQQKFSLDKVQHGLATISVDTQALTPVNDPVIEAQLIQRLSSGTLQFDIDAGRIAGQELDLDRRVLGFSGPSSVMHYVTRYTEKLLPMAEATASKGKAKR